MTFVLSYTFTLCTIPYTVYNIHYTEYTLYTIQYTIETCTTGHSSSIHYNVHTAHCTVHTIDILETYNNKNYQHFPSHSMSFLFLLKDFYAFLIWVF